MPISEDEYDSRQSNMQTSTNMDRMTKAELRRSNKPIMEKKRRARINHCLNELKSLILEAMQKDPARHSKLEKADILEMTVRHLQSVQRRQQQQQILQQQAPGDVNSLSRFRGGFGECAQEVAKCTKGLTGHDAEVARRLVAHLDNCVSGLNQITPSNPLGFPSQVNTLVQTPIAPTNTVTATTASNGFLLPGDVNNNGSQSNQRIQMGGVQLIPSRLPTGELALVLPNSSSLPFFPQTTPASSIQIGATSTSSRQSAFTAVISSQQKVVNPLLSPADTLSSDSNTSDEDANLNKTPARRPSPQQPHISSTTTISPESLKAAPLNYPSGYKDEGTKIYGFHLNQEETPKISNSSLSTTLWVESVQKNRKRQYDESNFLDEERKKVKVSSSDDFDKNENNAGKLQNQKQESNHQNNNEQQQQSSSDMWRPW